MKKPIMGSANPFTKKVTSLTTPTKQHIMGSANPFTKKVTSLPTTTTQPTAQTARSATPPPTVLPEGINPDFMERIKNSPQYKGPAFGAGFANPGTQAKISQVKNALQGKPMKKGGKVSSASKRADGIATKGKTKGRII